MQMAYIVQQHLDGYMETVENSSRRKEVFDRRVLGQSLGEVMFDKGQLVQIC